MTIHCNFLERDELGPSVELDYESNRRSHLPSPPVSQASPSTNRTELRLLRFCPETTVKVYPNGKRCTQYRCPMCDKVNDRKGNLERHLANAHKFRAHFLDQNPTQSGAATFSGRFRGQPSSGMKNIIARAREAVGNAQHARHLSEQTSNRRRKRKSKAANNSPSRLGGMIDLTRSTSPIVIDDENPLELQDAEQIIPSAHLSRTVQLHKEWQRQGVPANAARVLNEVLAGEQRDREKSLEQRAVTNDKSKNRENKEHAEEVQAPSCRMALETPPPAPSTSHAMVPKQTEAQAPCASPDVERTSSESPASQILPECASHSAALQPQVPQTPSREPVQPSPQVPSPRLSSTTVLPEPQSHDGLKRKRTSESLTRTHLKDPNADTKFVAAGLRQVSEDLGGLKRCMIEYSHAMSQMLDGTEQFRNGAERIRSDLQGMPSLLDKLEVRFQDIASRFDAPEEDAE